MLQIGLVGADSFHASAFSKLANLPPEQGGSGLPARITHLWGESPQRAQAVAREAGIPHLVSDPRQMLGQVDAVMIVLRRGSDHLAAAEPFLKAGIPTWVDKPLTCTLEEVRTLCRLARENSALLDGGSACRYCPDVLRLREAFLRMRQEGRFLSAHLNFPAEIDSPYDGLFFYGAHTAELLRTVFGPQVQSVRADVNNGNVIGLFRYPDFSVTVNFAEVGQFYGTLYGTQDVALFPIDISVIYKPAFKAFVERAEKRREPLPFAELFSSAAILDALARAAQTGRECAVADASGFPGPY